MPTVSTIGSISNIVPVLILGSGPAGLSAGLYTSRAKLKTVILTGSQPGGQLADVKYIENWPARSKTSGIDIMDDLKKQAEHFGAHVLYDAAKDIDLNSWPFTVKTENDLILRPLTLIYTTGGIAKKLDVPGVEDYWGRGVGICTICDAPFHKGQTVAVVGGGDTGAERALQLSVYAKKVYVIVREESLEAAAVVQDYLKTAQNITMLYSTEIIALRGNGTTLVDAQIRNTKTGAVTTIPLQGVYFAIGYHPNSDLVKKFIKTDDEGYIIVNSGTQKTSIPGFFAAGIVAIPDKPYGKSGVATGSGIKAGMDAIDFLEKIGFNPTTAEKIAPQLFISQNNEEKILLNAVSSRTQLQELYKKNPEHTLLVYIHSSSCPHCRTMQPLVEWLANEYKDTLTIGHIDHDQAKEFIEQLNITRVPYFMLFKKGKLIWRGTRNSKQELIELVVKVPQEEKI